LCLIRCWDFSLEKFVCTAMVLAIARGLSQQKRKKYHPLRNNFYSPVLCVISSLRMKASLLLVLAFAAFVLADWNPTFTLRSDSGRVQFVRGSLGTFDPLNAGAYFSRPEVARLLNLRGGEQFHMVSTDADTSGLLHSRFSQTLRGLEVDGGAVIVHFRPDTSVVFALTADVAPNDKDAPYTSFPASPLDARDALSQAAPSSVSPPIN
jgi:hypothetical protein